MLRINIYTMEEPKARVPLARPIPQSYLDTAFAVGLAGAVNHLESLEVTLFKLLPTMSHQYSTLAFLLSQYLNVDISQSS